MRIIVIADIHSNLAALRAVEHYILAEKPDVVVVAGDTINRGPRPRECLERVQEHVATSGWKIIRGNHEDYVIGEANADAGRPAWLQKVCRHSSWTYGRVADLLPSVALWPEETHVTGPDGKPVRIFHASTQGNRVGMYPQMSDAEMRPLVRDDASVFCVGHTHVPFVRHLGEQLVVNAGAVGMPFDRDIRASLALLEWKGGTWHAKNVRIEYERERTERDFEETGYLAEGGPMVPLILDEFRNARPRLGEWHRTFERLVAADHVTLEKSIEDILASP